MTDTDPPPIPPDLGENPANPEPDVDVDPAETYAGAIDAYLDAADWLTPTDAPLRVHARAIAKSLDKQMRSTGEVQSALASSFDKVLVRLEARRPATPPGPAPDPLVDGVGPHGEASIFGLPLG